MNRQQFLSLLCDLLQDHAGELFTANLWLDCTEDKLDGPLLSFSDGSQWRLSAVQVREGKPQPCPLGHPEANSAGKFHPGRSAYPMTGTNEAPARKHTPEQVQAARKAAIEAAANFCRQTCGGGWAHTIYSAETGEVRLEGRRRNSNQEGEPFCVFVNVDTLTARMGLAL